MALCSASTSLIRPVFREGEGRDHKRKLSQIGGPAPPSSSKWEGPTPHFSNLATNIYYYILKLQHDFMFIFPHYAKKIENFTPMGVTLQSIHLRTQSVETLGRHHWMCIYRPLNMTGEHKYICAMFDCLVRMCESQRPTSNRVGIGTHP